jgi:Adenylate and Guanylate cyclase catalytic domain
LPTGDGMVLVFTNNPEAPVECALEISQKLLSRPHLKLRMGIHSGPVNPVADVNDQANLAGAGINIAQRVMSCGDAGHILLSKHFAEDLEHYAHWRSHLHNVGEVQTKHGAKIQLVNLYTDQLGNAALPAKLKQARTAFRLKSAAVAGLLLIAMLGVGFCSCFCSFCSCSSTLRCSLRNSLSNMAFTAVISHGERFSILVPQH